MNWTEAHQLGDLEAMEERAMTDLKPCPFCGNDTVYLRTSLQETDVFCQDCEVMGPIKETEEEAIAAWNTRAGESHD